MGVYRLHKAYSPFYADNVSGFDFVQSSNSIYFAHLDYPPQKLTRADHTDWTFAAVGFAASIAAPAGVAAAPTQPNSTDAIATDYTYYVTAVDGNGEESVASVPDTASNDLSLQGNYNTVTWSAVAEAEFYLVYKGDNGAPGYIGLVQAPTLSFKDRNLTAILSDTPPLATNPFGSTGNYPSTVTFHQQRLFFGRTRNRPNAVWGSQSSLPENMDVSRPAKPDDALSFALLTDKVNSVNQLVSIDRDLVALGGDAVFSVTGSDGGVLIPADIQPKRESQRGGSRLNPIVVDKITFYVPEKSVFPRALGFTFEVDGYRSNNVAIFSPHFFKAHRIVRWAYQEEPYSCIWAARDDGVLLCFTWEEEQQVWGWTLCETEGYVEDVATIFEEGYDRLYALIRRTINGVEKRFFERLALPHFDDITTACHLDAAVTQISEEPSNVINGLGHLEGATVRVVVDGFVLGDFTVENGGIELPIEAIVRTAGLPYEGLVETLPLVLGQENHTERQSIGDVVIRALETRGLDVSTDGVNFDPLPDYDGINTWELPVEEAKDFEITPAGNWTDGSTLTIRQTQPLPAHITGVFIEMAVSAADQ